MTEEVNVDISDLTSDDLDDLVKLNEKCMFHGSGVRPHFEGALRNPDNIALKCTVNNKFAGASVYVKGVALVGEHHELTAQIKDLANGRTVYTGDSLTVKPEYRRIGLAHRLSAAMVERLRGRGIELVLHEFWVYPDGSIPAFKVLGMFKRGVFLGCFENFYKEYHHIGYTCSVCGADCVCKAAVYLDEVPGAGEDIML